LSALPTIPVTLLLCFGVFVTEPINCYYCINVNLWGGKSRLYSLEQNGWTVAAMSEYNETGCGHWPSIASRLRVEQG